MWVLPRSVKGKTLSVLRYSQTTINGQAHNTIYTPQRASNRLFHVSPRRTLQVAVTTVPKAWLQYSATYLSLDAA